MSQKSRRRGSERRQQPRADAKLSMMVEAPPDDGRPQQVVAESQNISASGVYCTSSHFLAPLSKVALTIVLPRLQGSRGKELVQCEGIVVRCQQIGSVSKRGDKRYELACMFHGLDDRRRDLLDAFVTWRNLQALRAATRPARGAARKPAARVAAKRSTSRALAARPATRAKRSTRTSPARRKTVR